jgi:hypothetical protein
MKNILLKSALILVGVSIMVIGGIAAVEAATPNAGVTTSAVTTTVTVAPNASIPSNPAIPAPTTTVIATKIIFKSLLFTQLEKRVMGRLFPMTLFY